jgi:hypothetical protein
MGLAVPILVVASMLGSTALRKKPWFRTRLVPLYALVVVILALGFVNSAANHFGYALPWQLPNHVHYRGRDYNKDVELGCTSRNGQQGAARQDGWVRGYFTTAKEIYVSTGARIPTALFVRGGRSCVVPYDLSGGP